MNGTTARFDTRNTRGLFAAVSKYLGEFPGDLICARQIWYEELGGYGTATDEDVAAIEAAVREYGGWTPAGSVRYEKFGAQNSFKKAKPQEKTVRKENKLMVQHLFKLNGLYKTPDGKTLKAVTSDVFNIRCFEFVNGGLTGKMIKFLPESDFAKSLVEAE
jgi:hypothetical protein